MFTQKRLWFSLALISLLFLFLFRNVDPKAVVQAVGQFNPLWLLPALFIYSMGYLVRSYRWKVLLAPIKECSFKNLFPVLLIGFTVNNLLPARLGELYRAHLNGKKEGISRSASLATIILERLFDGMAMLLILFIAVHMRRSGSTSLTPSMESFVFWATLLFGAAFVFFFAVLIFKDRSIRGIKYLVSHAPKKHHKLLEGIAHTFLDGLKILKNIKESILVLMTSVVAWSCEFLAFYAIAMGFHLAPEPLRLNSTALLMVITNLFAMIPLAPGGLGAFENAGKEFLAIYPIPTETAVAYVLIVHLFVLIPITLAGLFCLSREGLSLGSFEGKKGKRS